MQVSALQISPIRFSSDYFLFIYSFCHLANAVQRQAFGY